MTMEKPNRQNLDALVDTGQLHIATSEILLIDKNLVRPLPEQVRTSFNEKKIGELRESIRTLGQIEAIIVEPDPEGNGYLIVAGERRWRAIKSLDEIQDIRCIVREFENPRIRHAIQLAENFDREDLSIVDKAKGIEKLIQLHDGDVENAAKSIGKSRSTLLKIVSVLQLPEFAKQFVDDGYTRDYSTISMLRTLSKVDEEKAREIVDKYRQNAGENVPIRENLRAELDKLSAKKSKVSRQKQQTLTANEIYMQDDADKLFVVTPRAGLFTVKLDKLPEDIRTALYDILANSENAVEE